MFEGAYVNKLILPYNFAPRNIEEIFSNAEIGVLANSKRDGYNDENVVIIDGRNIENAWCAFAHGNIKTNIKIVGTKELRYIHQILYSVQNINLAIEGETCKYGIIDGGRILHLDTHNPLSECNAVLDLSKLKLSDKEHEILKREVDELSIHNRRYKIII